MTDLAHFGIIWHIFAKFLSVTQFLRILFLNRFGTFWENLAHFGTIFKYDAILENFITYQIWHILTQFINIRQFLRILVLSRFGTFWHILAHFVSMTQNLRILLLNSFGTFWHNLAHFGTIYKYYAIVENFST